MYKAVIFDLDGTLVNSLSDLAVACNYALEQHGFNTYPLDDYKYLIGDGMAKLIERAIPSEALNEETFKSVFKAFMDYYREHCLVHTYIYDGIENAVNKLKDMGLKLAVVSNKADDIAIDESSIAPISRLKRLLYILTRYRLQQEAINSELYITTLIKKILPELRFLLIKWTLSDIESIRVQLRS